MEKNALRKIKFKSLIEEWLQYKKTTIKESSYLNYKFIIDAVSSPSLNRTIVSFSYFVSLLI